MSEYEQELDQPGLDDEERAFRDAEKLRGHEQEDPDDDDVAPGPPVDDRGEELL